MHETYLCEVPKEPGDSAASPFDSAFPPTAELMSQLLIHVICDDPLIVDIEGLQMLTRFGRIHNVVWHKSSS